MNKEYFSDIKKELIRIIENDNVSSFNNLLEDEDVKGDLISLLQFTMLSNSKKIFEVLLSHPDLNDYYLKKRSNGIIIFFVQILDQFCLDDKKFYINKLYSIDNSTNMRIHLDSYNRNIYTLLLNKGELDLLSYILENYSDKNKKYKSKVLKNINISSVYCLDKMNFLKNIKKEFIFNYYYWFQNIPQDISSKKIINLIEELSILLKQDSNDTCNELLDTIFQFDDLDNLLKRDSTFLNWLISNSTNFKSKNKYKIPHIESNFKKTIKFLDKLNMTSDDFSGFSTYSDLIVNLSYYRKNNKKDFIDFVTHLTSKEEIEELFVQSIKSCDSSPHVDLWKIPTRIKIFKEIGYNLNSKIGGHSLLFWFYHSKSPMYCLRELMKMGVNIADLNEEERSLLINDSFLNNISSYSYNETDLAIKILSRINYPMTKVDLEFIERLSYLYNEDKNFFKRKLNNNELLYAYQLLQNNNYELLKEDQSYLLVELL